MLDESKQSGKNLLMLEPGITKDRMKRMCFYQHVPAETSAETLSGRFLLPQKAQATYMSEFLVISAVHQLIQKCINISGYTQEIRLLVSNAQH